MPEIENEEVVETETVVVETPIVEEEITDWKAEALRLKNEASKWETRSKTNYKELQGLKENQPETKTLEDRLNQLEKENFTLKKTQIAVKYSIPEKFVNRLQGASVEELEADAKELSETLKNLLPEPIEGASTQKVAPQTQELKKVLRLPQGSTSSEQKNTVQGIRTKEDFLNSRTTN